MTSRLGVYWSVEHRRADDYTYFKALQPTVFKLMDAGPPDYAFARDNLPGALVIARDWAMSEQMSDMLANPVGTGQRHAQEWNNHQVKLGFDRAKTLILGINEPHIWEPGVPEALRLYTISLCLEAKKYSLRVGAMQLSVGWPNNNGPDTPPDWSPFHGVEQAIIENGGALICHEYWADKGPSENWGWWAGRSLKCPWQVPIVIGETGVDMFVKDTSVGQNNRGWIGHMAPERYAAELVEYVNRMGADPRFVGCCVFASDFQAHEWYSFDVQPAYKAILAALPSIAQTPVVTHLPQVSVGTGPTEPPAKSATLFVIAPAGLNIRDAAATGNIIARAPFGAPVTVTGVSSSDPWVAVRYQDKTGWAASAYLAVEPPKPQPQPPMPEPAQPSQPADKWQRSIDFVLSHEGGYQNNPADLGNWTGGKQGVGENLGTNFGISAASYPNLDIKNINQAQAIAIYERDFWIPSGASALDFPACLIVFDSAVLHGVGTAQKWLAETGPNPFAFAAKRLRVYTKLSNGDVFWRGWIARVADLLEAAKP